MADPSEKLRAQLREETAESERQLQASVRAALTRDQLRKDWDHARGKAERTRPTASSGLDWRELWLALAASKTAMRSMSLVTVVLVAAIIVFTLSPQETVRQMAALPKSDLAGTRSLPRFLRLEPKRGRLQLVEGTTRLKGQMRALPNLSQPGVQAFTNNLNGTDSTGAQIWVRCVVWVTNVSGVNVMNKSNEVTGVLVAGALEVVGQSTNAVEQGYAP